MELRQLKALQAIADIGNFREAAEVLGLTQSALSHQLRALEEELGETLIVRARPRSYPTPAGREVLTTATQITEALAALEHRFAVSRIGPAVGTLRVAATPMSFTYLLAPLCEAFQRRYPKIELVFAAAESAEQAVRRVLSGASDVAFGPLSGEHESLAEVRLARAEHTFVVRQGHPLAHRRMVTVDELRRFPIALFLPKSGTRSITDAVFEECYPTILTESNDSQFIKRMVSISDASALMVAYAMAADGLVPELHCLRLEGQALWVDVGLVHKKSVQMNTLELFKSVCLDMRGPRPVQLQVGSSLNAFQD